MKSTAQLKKKKKNKAAANKEDTAGVTAPDAVVEPASPAPERPAKKIS